MASKKWSVWFIYEDVWKFELYYSFIISPLKSSQNETKKRESYESWASEIKVIRAIHLLPYGTWDHFTEVTVILYVFFGCFYEDDNDISILQCFKEPQYTDF